MDVLTGLSNTESNVQYSCPSAHCSWPPYESLGLCTKCWDVTKQVQTICNNITIPWTPPREELHPQNASIGFYTLPSDASGFKVTTFATLWDKLEGATVWTAVVKFNSSTQPGPLWQKMESVGARVSHGVLGSSTMLMRLNSMRFADDQSFSTLAEATLAIPEITVCDLVWCANTYASSRVDSGVLYDIPTTSTPINVDFGDCMNVDSQYPGSAAQVAWPWCRGTKIGGPSLPNTANFQAWYNTSSSIPGLHKNGTYWFNGKTVYDLLDVLSISLQGYTWGENSDVLGYLQAQNIPVGKHWSLPAFARNWIRELATGSDIGVNPENGFKHYQDVVLSPDEGPAPIGI